MKIVSICKAKQSINYSHVTIIVILQRTCITEFPFSEVDQCISANCGTHGICVDTDTGKCNCTDGYTGEHCDISRSNLSNLSVCFYVAIGCYWLNV